MATATCQKFRISANGEFFTARWTYPANIIINAQTTISATAGTNQFTIADSGNGLAAIAIGKQIEMTGWTAAALNGFFEVMASSASSLTLRLRNNANSDSNGATEAAGNSITISIVARDVSTTKGTIALSDGTDSYTATVKNVVHKNEAQQVHVFVDGTVSPIMEWGKTITATVAQGDAWTNGDGDENAALSAVDISTISEYSGNGSLRLDAAADFDYDNIAPIVNGVGEAPVGTPAAVDPSTISGLIDWWAPDLEVGYSDGDNITTLVGQNGAQNLTTRSGASWPQRYNTNVAGGKAMTWLNGTGDVNDGFRRAWVNSTLGDWVTNERTVIAFFLKEQGAGSVHQSYNRAEISKSRDFNFHSNTGGGVVSNRLNTSGAGSTFNNYGKVDITGQTAEQIRVAISSGPNTAAQIYTGRVYAYDRVLTDDEIRSATRWLLDFYGVDWAPTFYVSSTGNNANDGTSGSPLLTAAEALGRITQNSTAHILIAEDDDPAVALGGGIATNTPTDRRSWGYSLSDPIALYPNRTSAKKYPVFYQDDKTTLVTMSGTQAGAVFRNFMVFGAVCREGKKIPTGSPLRLGRDRSYDAALATSSPVFDILGSDDAGDAIDCDFVAVNCHGVGAGLIVSEKGPFSQQINWNQELYRTSYAHAYNTSGRSQGYFVSHVGTVIVDDMVGARGGWEPGIAADNIFDHNFYNQYTPGNRIWCRVASAEASSHFLQARAGGYMTKSMSVDDSISTFWATGESTLEDTLIENGKDIDGLARGWGPHATSAAEFNARRVLAISTGYASGFSFRVNGTDAYTDDNTVKDENAVAYCQFDDTTFKCNLENITVVARPGNAFEFLKNKHINASRLLIQEDTTPLVFTHTDAELTAAAVTLTNSNLDLSAGSFAETDDGTKTKAQLEALIDTASGNTEASVTFVDDTRSVQSYARADLADPTAEPIDFFYTLIAERAEGTYDADHEIDTIREWVLAGYFPTNLNAADYGGTLPGASFEGPPTPPTPTVVGRARNRSRVR